MSSVHRPAESKPSQDGFTLLEVLVALFILSVGLLGAARLEVLSLRSNASSALRTQAVNLAYDMADRMRANRRGMVAANGSAIGFYNAANATTYVLPADNDCSQGPVDPAQNCTTAQMAANDLWEWTNSLAALLPGGVGVTCVDSTPQDGSFGVPACDNVGGAYAVKVWWTDLEADGPVTKRLVLTVRP